MSQCEYEGRFLRVLNKDGWEYVERTNLSGIVGILAVTKDDKFVFIDEFRPPVKKIVMGIPARLAGDIKGEEEEALVTAAHRELLEETGYQTSLDKFFRLGDFPLSPGLSSEVITIFHAADVKKIADGGGDENENIRVFLMSPEELISAIQSRNRCISASCLTAVQAYLFSEQFLNKIS